MTVYTHTARFDTGRAMTEDELRRAAPRFFAMTAHEKPLRTISADPDQDKGFSPTAISSFVNTGRQVCLLIT
jgi:hypothetical protein